MTQDASRLCQKQKITGAGASGVKNSEGARNRQRTVARNTRKETNTANAPSR